MKKYFYIIFIIVTFKIKYAETPAFTNTWVVWDIGQGQWVTHILPDECRHYDAGGEPGSFKTVKKSLLHHCGNKLNKLNLSHWDFDHILNIPYLARTLPDLCWQNLPEFGHKKPSAQKILALNILACEHKNNSLKIWVPFIAKDTNSSSIIFYDQKVLSTGDSPIQQEKIWISELEDIASTRVLILGHHGSRTSTGKELLSHLPNLNFAVASARYAKYKHPHKDTLARLKEFKIPVLKTEDWGNIWFE